MKFTAEYRIDIKSHTCAVTWIDRNCNKKDNEIWQNLHTAKAQVQGTSKATLKV